jgi:hypothetical protein
MADKQLSLRSKVREKIPRVRAGRHRARYAQPEIEERLDQKEEK